MLNNLGVKANAHTYMAPTYNTHTTWLAALWEWVKPLYIYVHPRLVLIDFSAELAGKCLPLWTQSAVHFEMVRNSGGDNSAGL